MVAMAFREIRMLPERKNVRFGLQANKFEKGLSDFVNRVLRNTFESFQQQHYEAQNLKKRAALQLIQSTMAGRKKMYNRWKTIHERSLLT